MSSFDPDTFLNSETTDSNDTQYYPAPAKEYPMASIDAIKPRTAGDKPVLDVMWLLNDDEAKEVTGMDSPKVKQTIWLDLTPSGGLDFGKGKNVQLGKLREAVGQNSPGQRWAPGMLLGQVACIKVEHKAGQNGETFANVTAVTAA